MSAFIETFYKVVDGVKSTIFPQTSTAAVLDFTQTTPRTQAAINADLQAQVNEAKEQYNHVTKEWYSTADANTNKTGNVWEPINPALDYLDKDAIYILEDATYGSELQNVITEMFVPITKADYDALVAAGTVNPVAYYFIIYPTETTD